MAHQSFATTGRGLRRSTPPMRLYEKAKRFGIWNPSDEEAFIDYATAQFNKRIERVEAARGATLEEIYRVTHSAIAQDDA